MKWFKHESDAHLNIKLQRVIESLGLAGYGYYWACVELVASQGNDDFSITKEKNWQFFLQKMLNIPLETQKEYLLMFARHNLIDKEALKKGILYIPKLEERCDEYTEKVRRKSGQGRDNVGLEEKRRDKNREEESKSSPESSFEYLLAIPEDDQFAFYKKFKATRKDITSKGESLYHYCKSNGKKYKDYKSLLRNALEKDFGQRDPEDPKRNAKIVERGGKRVAVIDESIKNIAESMSTQSHE